MRTYTEEKIRSAWRAAVQLYSDSPSHRFERGFFQLLAATKPKEEPVLFTKAELLDVAATGHEKVMVHGIFAVLGMDMANEAALLSKARDAMLGGNMKIVIELAKAKKEQESYLPGDVIRDANGIYYKLTTERMWATFEHAMHLDFGAPRRPLEKMP